MQTVIFFKQLTLGYIGVSQAKRKGLRIEPCGTPCAHFCLLDWNALGKTYFTVCSILGFCDNALISNSNECIPYNVIRLTKFCMKNYNPHCTSQNCRSVFLSLFCFFYFLILFLFHKSWDLLCLSGTRGTEYDEKIIFLFFLEY